MEPSRQGRVSSSAGQRIDTFARKPYASNNHQEQTCADQKPSDSSVLRFFFFSASTAARAQGGSRTYFNQDIFIAQGQQVHNATCIFCSVQIEGDLTGNVFVLFGNLNVTGRVDGRTTVIGGNAVIDLRRQGLAETR